MDRLEQLENLFHIDGPHDRDSVIDAAGGVAHLVRYLNHATQPSGSGRRTLEWASTTHSVLSELTAAAYRAEQLLQHLTHALDRSATDSTLYDDRRDGTDAAETAAEASARVAHAAGLAGQLGTRLDFAKEITVHLGND